MATIAKDTIYENFVLENKMTDLVNTNLDVNALFTRDDSLTTEAGLDKIVHVYEYDGKVEQLGKGDKNTARGKVSWKPEKYTVKRYQQTFDYNDMDIMQDPYLLDVATAGASVAAAAGACSAGASVSSPAGANSAVLSPSLPITHTLVRQGTSSPSSKKTASIVPSTLLSSSNEDLSVS